MPWRSKIEGSILSSSSFKSLSNNANDEGFTFGVELNKFEMKAAYTFLVPRLGLLLNPDGHDLHPKYRFKH